MAFVNKQGGEEKRDSKAASGLPIDFDPNDDTVVKVHYDLSAWSLDQRGEVAEALADAEIPHFWDDEELVVPEEAEPLTDAMFEKLEEEFGPFPIGLDEGDESTEYGLDEWTDGDRTVLTEAMIEAEIPHRWDGTTVVVAADAEETVDDLLDAIETGELRTPESDAENEPPDGVLGDIFLVANKLAKDPFDAKSRHAMIDFDELLDPNHPPYQLAPRVWTRTVAGVSKIVERVHADADGERVQSDSDRLDESSDVIGLAQQLRETVRDYV